MDAVEMEKDDGIQWVKERKKEIMYMPYDTVVCVCLCFVHSFASLIKV
jgi:hypothetical protein